MLDAVRKLLLFAAVVFALLCEVAFGLCDGTRCRDDRSDRPNGGVVVVEEERRHFAAAASPNACPHPRNPFSPMIRSASCVRPVSVLLPSRKYLRDYSRSIDVAAGKCGRGSFVMDGMTGCHPCFTCEYIAAGKLILGDKIGSGAVKQVYHAFWKGHELAVSTPSTIEGITVYPDDFEQGLSNQLLLGPSVHLVMLIGHCDHPPMIITEYHRHGNANNVGIALRNNGINDADDILKIRFRLCLDYVAILQWLHNSPSGGARIMCDSSTLQKTLEQYLITDELRLVLNDVDAVPLVIRNEDNRSTTVCGRRQLHGTFAAPEQLWPHVDRPYEAIEMPGYDEKTDIWKVPDVCEFFLSGSPGRDIVVYRLFKLHARCKSVAPDRRPTAAEIMRLYEGIWSELFET